MTLETDAEIIAGITGKLKIVPKRKRAKPHRCIDCGKVSARIRCTDCWTRRLEM